MTIRPIPEYRLLVTVDIEDYSSRTDSEQRTLQNALREILDRAADMAELNREAWDEQENGDSIYAMLPPGSDVLAVMDPFIRNFDAGLGTFNRLRVAETWSRLRVRMAVHIGPVQIDGALGWVGQHPVLPARLRDSRPVRVALEALPGADLAVIVSSEIFRDYIGQGPGEPRLATFRVVQVAQKKQHYLAYLYVPGFDLAGISALSAYDPDGGTDGGAPAPEAPRPPDTTAPRIAAYGSGDAIGGDKVSGDKTLYYGERPNGR